MTVQWWVYYRKNESVGLRKRKRRVFAYCTLCAIFFYLLFSPLPANAIKKQKLKLLQRIHTYAATIDTTDASSSVSYAYTRATLRVEKRNVILKLVPTASVVTRGKEREYVTETYDKIKVYGLDNFKISQIMRLTTVPHRKLPMPNFSRFLTPDVYGETIVGNSLLSPFYPNNFKFYKYKIIEENNGEVTLTFHPKRKNTQLVHGSAKVNFITGHVISADFRGEFDMMHFWISMKMNKHGYTSLFPAKCEGLFLFKFLGNRVSGHYKSYFGLPKVISDTISNDDMPKMMDIVRPDTLNELDETIYKRKIEKQRQDSIYAAQDTTKHKKNWMKNILWDTIGDNVLNRIKSNFGMNNRGYVRLNPILNPLYMGYDHRRGFTYKIDVRASYQLGENSEINGRFKGGYSFKQKRFYYRVPLYYYFNRRRNGYLKYEMGNGNHIGNLTIQEDILKQNANAHSIVDVDLLNDFKQSDYRLELNYDINNYLGFNIGALYQRKVAVNKYAFNVLGWTDTYSSFAPKFEIQIRPWGWYGPIFTADYDRAIKGALRTNAEYERMEFNGEYIHKINRLQSLQMRVGGGFYTMKGMKTYFLNYENFHEDNIPGGWNDDWSGEFELLNSDTYNTSDYYIRANVTYESPLLILSWLPIVGKFMEMERIYVSALDVESTHPYIELGYGFTTRAFSAGIFGSNGHGNRTFGVKFGFELFSKW